MRSDMFSPEKAILDARALRKIRYSILTSVNSIDYTSVTGAGCFTYLTCGTGSAVGLTKWFS